MNKHLFTMLLFLTLGIYGSGQNGNSAIMPGLHIGYGTENNWGNTVFFGGADISKVIKKKLLLSAGITRFTTGVYNAYENQSFDNEERFYKGWYITPKISYQLIGNNGSFFSATVSAGPSIKFFNYKIFKTGLIKYYSDGRREPIDSTLKWYQDKGMNIVLYTGVSFNFQLSSTVTTSLFVDTYSHQIPIDFFLPGIKVSYRMLSRN